MKRFFYFLSALALILMPSCKNNSGVNLDTITEDGFYVAGPATGSATLSGQFQMGPGSNEKEKAYRVGMYEKYIVLEAGKDFELKLYEAGQETRYSAVLEEYTPDLSSEAYSENPTFAFYRGELKIGESAPAMQVAKAGMYHIVLDLNKNGDLQYPQIIVVPVESWYYRGAITDSWEDVTPKKCLAPTKVNKVSANEITWVFEDVKLFPSNWFKFVYSDAWKITLDIQGKVKAETSLGVDADDPTKISQRTASGDAGNFYVPERGVYDIELTYKMAGGRVSNSFSYKFTRKADYVLDPAEFVVGLSGSAVESGWGDPKGTSKGVYSASESNVTDATEKTGTYVFNLTGVELSGEFKVRVNGDWIGGTGVAISGDLEHEGDDNIKVKNSGIYDIKITFDWNGSAVSNVKAAFTRKGDLLLNPANFVVGISGVINTWGDPSGATKAAYNSTESQQTNATTKAGTYVYDIKGLTFSGQFKFRRDGDWWGPSDGVTVTGVTLTDADGNYNLAEEGTYDIKITLTWDGNGVTAKKADFTKK